MQSATFKICIFGTGGVGKTTLVQRYITGRFRESTKMTIGADILIKELEFNDWKVRLQIWDFGGEERFRFFLPPYARGAFAGIFMYDITRYNSLIDFDDWVNIFMKGASFGGNEVPILMVGGKLDLDNRRMISTEDVSHFALNRNVYKIIECSSKTGQNVELIFRDITQKIMQIHGLL